MNERKRTDITVGGLLLLLFLLTMPLLSLLSGLPEPGDIPGEEKVFVEISGDISAPGIYGFRRRPSLEDLLRRAGGLTARVDRPRARRVPAVRTGTHVCVCGHGEQRQIITGEMTAFYKVTLGIPVSLNRESLEGLTAIPGIGATRAAAIIRARTRRGGFNRLEDLLLVQGIGPGVFEKVSRYLIL